MLAWLKLTLGAVQHPSAHAAARLVEVRDLQIDRDDQPMLRLLHAGLREGADEAVDLARRRYAVGPALPR